MWKTALIFLFFASTASTSILLFAGGAWNDWAALAASVGGGIILSTLETYLSPDDLWTPGSLSMILAVSALAACAVFNHYLDTPMMKALNPVAGVLAALSASQIGRRYCQSI